MLSSRIESSFTIKNNTVSSVCFKVKTSAKNEFLVSPTTSVIRSKDEAMVQVTFTGPPESRNKGQKLQVQIAFTSDLKLVDWDSKENLDFRLGTKFMVADVEEKPVESNQSHICSYASIEFENDLGTCRNLEEEKKNLSDKNNSITSEIRQLTQEIDQVKYKLRFKKETSHVSTSHKNSKYSIPHVFFSFVTGLFFGFYILA